MQTLSKPETKAGKAKKTKKSCKGRKPAVRKGMAASLIDKVLTTMDKHKEVDLYAQNILCISHLLLFALSLL